MYVHVQDYCKLKTTKKTVGIDPLLTELLSFESSSVLKSIAAC